MKQEIKKIYGSPYNLIKDEKHRILTSRIIEVLSLKSDLSEREKQVLKLRFGLDDGSEPKTLEQVGKIIGVTRERIRQIEAKAFEIIKHTIKI